MKKYFLYNIIIFSLFTSCSAKLFKGMDSEGKNNFSKAVLYQPQSCIGDNNFNVKLEYKENSFDGILVKTSGEEEGSARIILTTYFGMSVFDFEISKNDMKVNRCIEQMDKSFILSLLEEDFRTLFLLNVNDTFNAKKYISNSNYGYRINTSDGKIQYLTDENNKQLKEIYKSGLLKKLDINFGDNIVIDHPKLNLKITLTNVQ